MNSLELVGAPGSPYSRKMRALMRYRQIPFVWSIQGQDRSDMPRVPVNLIPVLVFRENWTSNDEAMIDSSFQIRRLETLFSDRSVIPEDPGMALLNALIEDYADEWLTKAMFHYRWAHKADIEKAGKVLPRWRLRGATDEEIAPLSKMFVERQVGRLGVVGSNSSTGAFIEDSYRRFLRAFDRHLTGRGFVLGDRPGSADFAIFGQLTQLAQFDPTPMAVTLEESPTTYAWVDVVEDLSGLRLAGRDWISRVAVPGTLRALLAEVGRTYSPFLLANAAALQSGAEQVECDLDGHKWVQKPFPYQGKCLGWLREGYAELADDDRDFVDSVLEGTGCEALFSG